MSNQNKEDPDGATSYIYMQPLGGVNVKPWGKSDYGFPCCWGTLSESFAKVPPLHTLSSHTHVRCVWN